jgi:hypothetical protein
MSFAAITLCVASQRVFIVAAVYFVIDSVRKIWIHLVLRKFIMIYAYILNVTTGRKEFDSHSVINIFCS